MAIFTGKIIEAYYADADKKTIEIIYQDGKKAINHYLPVDNSHTDFKDLIREYSQARISETTVKRNKKYLNQLNRVVEGRMKTVQNIKPIAGFDGIMDFILDYSQKKHAEKLFDLKIKIFDKEEVKNFDGNDEKKAIRQASNPLDVLIAYRDIVEKSKQL